MKLKSTALFFYFVLFTFYLQAQPLLTLDNAIDSALTNNLDIQVFRNTAEVATVSNNWSLAGKIPTAATDFGYTYGITNLNQNLSNGTTTKRNGNNTRNFTGRAGVDFVLFNGFRIRYTKRQLEQEQQVGELNLKQQSNQTVFDVITNYYNIARLQQQISTLQQTITLFEDRVKLAKARFEIGTTAKNDYLQSEIDLKEQQTTLLGFQNQLQQAKTTLNTFLARDPNIDFSVDSTVQTITLPEQQQVLRSLDTSNYRILSSQASERSIIQQYGIIKSLRYPALGISAGLGFARTNNSAGFTLLNQTLGPQAGFTLSIPLFNGGVVRKQLQINDIQLKSQQIQTQSIRNELRGTLVNAYKEYANAQQQYALQQENLILIRENNFIATERFKRAAITLVELREVQINLVTAQARLIDAQYTMKLDAAALQFLTGSLANK
jgi:outer membrane protein